MEVTIELCGQLSVSVDGRRREGDLPGRQGRLALAYLALHMGRPVTRERLIAALWGDDAPTGHSQALNVVLSKLRRSLGAGVVENAGERAVQLTTVARVDLDAVQPALDEAFAARDKGDWEAVMEAADRVAAAADAGLLPGYEAGWLDEPRRRLEEHGLQARELRGDAGLALGGAELAHAERAAQEIVERAEFRESGYLLLMRVREAQGNLVEALRVHERLRTLLRDELGVAPGPQVQAEFERLLKAEQSQADAPPPPPPATRPVEEHTAPEFFATRAGAVRRPPQRARAPARVLPARRRGPAPARAARRRARDRQDAAGRPVHGGVRGGGRARALRPLRRRHARPLPAVRGGAAPLRRRHVARPAHARGAPSSAA